MNILLVLYAEYGLGLAGVLAFVGVYIVHAWGAWHTNVIGQALVALGAVAGVWYVKGLISHGHNTSTWNLVFYGLFALLFCYLAVAFYVVLVRRERRKQ